MVSRLDLALAAPALTLAALLVALDRPGAFAAAAESPRSPGPTIDEQPKPNPDRTRGPTAIHLRFLARHRPQFYPDQAGTPRSRLRSAANAHRHLPV
jgi:hypothetical protein